MISRQRVNLNSKETHYLIELLEKIILKWGGGGWLPNINMRTKCDIIANECYERPFWDSYALLICILHHPGVGVEKIFQYWKGYCLLERLHPTAGGEREGGGGFNLSQFFLFLDVLKWFLAHSEAKF